MPSLRRQGTTRVLVQLDDDLHARARTKMATDKVAGPSGQGRPGAERGRAVVEKLAAANPQLKRSAARKETPTAWHKSLGALLRAQAAERAAREAATAAKQAGQASEG